MTGAGSSTSKGGVRYSLARAISGAAAWGLVNIAHREAGNMPGKLARYADPQVIGHAASAKLRLGSIAVVGTNGKTTVTNLIADAVEAFGMSIICNRSGANLYSGIATALLRAKGVHDWGIFESDELWLAKSLPQLKCRYVVLLNLFRDQLDRCGEIDRIQDSIVGALASSPETVLIYNADDPLCAMVAARASEVPSRKGVPSISFGVDEDMGLEQNLVSDSTMCQNCSHMLRYDYRQYGQLGPYECPNCGFARPELQFAAKNVDFDIKGISFDVNAPSSDASSQQTAHIHASLSGSYMVYNLLAVFAASRLLGCSYDSIQRAIDAFDPKNGRLQEYSIGGHSVLLNLAKNPTGFNQNLRIITRRLDAEGSADVPSPSVVAFFINDKEADGHDISWIWDIDFEELAGREGLHVLAGGIRRNDLQVRLKYAGVKAKLVESAADVLAAAESLGPDVPVYAITNYTALASVHDGLGKLAEAAAPGVAASASEAGVPEAAVQAAEAGAPTATDSTAEVGAPEMVARAAEAVGPEAEASAPASETPEPSKAPAPPSLSEPVVIAHMFPDLLNLYGDGGNVRILEQRLKWRGIPVEVRHVTYGETVDLSDVDLVFMGGGPDKEQSLAAEELHKMRDGLARFVADGGPVLAICGGYQIMGATWLLGEEEVPGLGIIDAATRRPGTSGDRLINNIALKSELAEKPVIGYENHASRTYLASDEQAFGKVASRMGCGNNDDDAEDGIIHGNAIGTYLHGPLLSKNPEVADWLLARALGRHAARTGAAHESFVPLLPLDDAEEMAANDFMAEKII